MGSEVDVYVVRRDSCVRLGGGFLGGMENLVTLDDWQEKSGSGGVPMGNNDGRFVLA